MRPVAFLNPDAMPDFTPPPAPPARKHYGYQIAISDLELCRAQGDHGNFFRYVAEEAARQMAPTMAAFSNVTHQITTDPMRAAHYVTFRWSGTDSTVNDTTLITNPSVHLSTGGTINASSAYIVYPGQHLITVQNAATNAFDGYGRAFDAATVAMGQLVGTMNTALGTMNVAATDMGALIANGLTMPSPSLPDRATRLRIESRADKLWLAHLSDGQRRQWLDVGYVDVPVAAGRTYRIRKGRSGNVRLLNADGTEVRRYCAYAKDPVGILPDGDHYFAQLMTLRFNEREFLRHANTWDLLASHQPFIGQGVDVERAL